MAYFGISSTSQYELDGIRSSVVHFHFQHFRFFRFSSYLYLCRKEFFLSLARTLVTTLNQCTYQTPKEWRLPISPLLTPHLWSSTSWPATRPFPCQLDLVLHNFFLAHFVLNRWVLFVVTHFEKSDDAYQNFSKGTHVSCDTELELRE